MTELPRPPERKANQNLSFGCFNYFFALFDQTSPKSKETKTWQQRLDNCMFATTSSSQNFTTATSPKQQRSLKRAYRLPKPPTTRWTFKLILKFIQGQNRAWSKLLNKGAVSRNSLKFKQWERPPNWVELKNNNSTSVQTRNNNTANTKGAQLDKLEEWNGSNLWFVKTC